MFKIINAKYKNLHLLTRFVINIVFLSLLWIIFYVFFRYNPYINEFYEYIVDKFTRVLLLAGKFLLGISGFDIEIEGKVIRISGTSGVLLDKGCLGRNLLGLFAGFILAYPSQIKHKLWAIPLGLLIIMFLNVLRIAALTVLVHSYPDYVDINHHVIFKYTVYFFIFCMWYFWIKYYGSTSKAQQTEH